MALAQPLDEIEICVRTINELSRRVIYCQTHSSEEALSVCLDHAISVCRHCEGSHDCRGTLDVKDDSWLPSFYKWCGNYNMRVAVDTQFDEVFSILAKQPRLPALSGRESVVARFDDFMPQNLDTFAPRWWVVEARSQVEAVTVVPSVTVYLTGVDVGLDVNEETKIRHAWVTEGVQTRGTVLWEALPNQTIPYSPADYSHKLSISPTVELKSNTSYTIAITYAKDSKLFNGKSGLIDPAQCAGQDRVIFYFSEPEFAIGDTKGGFNSTAGPIFKLYYKTAETLGGSQAG